MSFAASATLLARTLPFLLLRVAVYFGIAAAFIVAAIGGGGIGSALGTIAGPTERAAGAFWGAVAGFCFVALLVRWLREYLLYFVEAGHAAAMALAIDSGNPGIASAMTAVQRRFRDAPALLTAERLVRGTLHAVVRTTNATARLLSPGITLSHNLHETASRLVLGAVTASLLALAMRRRERNVYADLQALLVLFAQNGESLLHRAALIAAASIAATVAAFLVVLFPVLALMQPGTAGAWLIALAIAAVLAWSVRHAFIEPFAVAAMLERSARMTADQEPDPDWDARLAELSPPYREIKVMAPVPRAARRGIVV